MVTDDWANDVQEEIVNVITDQGIALVKGTQTQLLDAVKSIVSFGGDAQSTVAIANNDAGPTDVTGLLFDKANVKSAIVKFDLERRTDTQNEQESGEMRIMHDTADDVWRIELQTSGDDAGVTFSITSGGQVQYSSDDLTGSNYVGELRIGQIISIKQ